MKRILRVVLVAQDSQTDAENGELVSFHQLFEGGFVAIYLDPNAMFNMTRDGADVDERWGANDKKIPDIGTNGELVIRIATS